MNKLFFILCLLYSFPGITQDIVIKLKSGEEIKTSVSANSSSTLYTKNGNYSFQDISSVYFNSEDADHPLKERLRNSGITVSLVADKGIIENDKIIMTFTTNNEQYIEGLPIDEKGIFIVSNVVEEPATDKDKLYSRARLFFAETFRSAQDVIQMDDIASGIIVGKGITYIYPTGAKTTMRYSVKIQVKDGRYKYDIYDVSYEVNSTSPYVQSSTFTATGAFNKNVALKKNGTLRNYSAELKSATIDQILNLQILIVDAMSKKLIDNDW